MERDAYIEYVTAVTMGGRCTLDDGGLRSIGEFTREYEGNMWGGPDPRIPGTHEFGPWELVDSMW